MGPSAIRYAGLGRRLTELGHRVQDQGNLHVRGPENSDVGDAKVKYLDSILAACEQLAKTVEATCARGGFPLVLGGDHSIAIGSITGVAQAHGPIGVMWIDAHGDFNTPETSPSGNIHGMPLATLLGYGNERLTHLGGFSPKVTGGQVAIVGVRELDAGEQDLLRQSAVHVFTMKEIDRLGLAETMTRALEITGRGTTGVHVSLDIDVVDPREAPGVGTPVRGGLTYREAHLAMELIADSAQMRSLDIVEVNPILDEANRTADLAVELALSALGKNILPSGESR
jgi:arginase